jgi:hypothetical protein
VLNAIQDSRYVGLIIPRWDEAVDTNLPGAALTLDKLINLRHCRGPDSDVLLVGLRSRDFVAEDFVLSHPFAQRTGERMGHGKVLLHVRRPGRS